ncbi:hypothetical protein FRC08_007592 [Ceratobasidium sp. 394]|nr:hypothetical protein FRC08_007592 [Ceratobasidium sp. 394]KAG9089076.1 hypothetical protein FS749_001643 [Ceratobasidium sp. UAMH 11750]
MSSLLSTTHAALILPSAGTSACISPVTISSDVRHRGYLHPRSVDLRPYNHLIHVRELNIEGTQYLMHYALAPSLPVNKSVLHILGLPNAPKERLVYRGDVVFVKVVGPSPHGAFVKDVCDKCYGDVSISVLPFVTTHLQKFWQQRMLDSEFAIMRQQATNPGARRGMTEADFEILVTEVQEIEDSHCI